MKHPSLLISGLVISAIVNIGFLAGCGGGAASTRTGASSSGGDPVPTITTISPTSTVAGSPAFTLTVNGTNFVSSSSVNFGGTAVATTFVSSTQLSAAIPAGLIASAGTAAVTVTSRARWGHLNSHELRHYRL